MSTTDIAKLITDAQQLRKQDYEGFRKILDDFQKDQKEYIDKSEKINKEMEKCSFWSGLWFGVSIGVLGTTSLIFFSDKKSI